MNPIDALFAAVVWEPVPPVEHRPGERYATQTGVLALAGLRLRCYVLDNGERVIDADDMERLMIAFEEED